MTNNPSQDPPNDKKIPALIKGIQDWLDDHGPEKHPVIWKYSTFGIIVLILLVAGWMGYDRQRGNSSWDFWFLVIPGVLWGILVVVYVLANVWENSRVIPWMMMIVPFFLILSAFIVWRQWTYRTDVVVLKHDLPAYHLLTADDAIKESRRWVGLPDGALRETSGIEGRITLTELDEGQPLEEGHLSPAFSEIPVMINVPITRAMASDGDIEAGTFVDISLAPADEDDEPTVLQGSVVLDVHGPDAGEDPGAPGDVTYIMTLALTQSCHDQFVLAGGTVGGIAAHLHRTASTTTIAEASSTGASTPRRFPCFQPPPALWNADLSIMTTSGDDRGVGEPYEIGRSRLEPV